MNHILQRPGFLRFAAGVRNVIEGTSYLGVLLRLPDVGRRWLVRVLNVGVVIEIAKWGQAVSAFLRVNLPHFLRLNFLRLDFLRLDFLTFDCQVCGLLIRSDFWRRILFFKIPYKCRSLMLSSKLTLGYTDFAVDLCHQIWINVSLISTNR